MQTTVVRIQRKQGEIVQDCDIYIGRACYRGGWELPQSKWHNPYSVNTYGDQAIPMYENYLRNNPELLAALPELVGKRLGCWCKPGPCHGDVIVKLLDEYGYLSRPYRRPLILNIIEPTKS